MKRFMIVLMVLGLVAGSMAAAEAKKKPTRVERTVEGSYNGPWLPFRTFVCAPSEGIGCVTFFPRRTEAFLTAKVTDEHGQPVFVRVYQAGEWVEVFCGETTEPISIDPGIELELWIGYWGDWFVYWPGQDLDCLPGVATTGTVSVTLSNLP